VNRVTHPVHHSEREREREVKGWRALSVPHSVSQSACVIFILIWMVGKIKWHFERHFRSFKMKKSEIFLNQKVFLNLFCSGLKLPNFLSKTD
jgi:hypothetical protein